MVDIDTNFYTFEHELCITLCNNIFDLLSEKFHFYSFFLILPVSFAITLCFTMNFGKLYGQSLLNPKQSFWTFT